MHSCVYIDAGYLKVFTKCSKIHTVTVILVVDK